MTEQGKTGPWYRRGTVVRRAVNVGAYVELVATVGGTDYPLGTVRDGNILFEARLAAHAGPSGPGKVKDVQVPAAVAVEFRGIMEEVHRENVLLLLNRPPDDPKVGDPGDT